MAVCWLFPKQEVRIDCPCLACGEPIRVRMRDGELLSVDPPDTVGHSNIPYGRWREDIARA
ncbi:MAG: hypothetical protein ACM3N3_09480 [Betaproteobacteria bacterium]